MADSRPDVREVSIEAATRASLDAATHLTPADVGATTALLIIAQQLDDLMAGDMTPALRMTLANYFEALGMLGLTPLSRKRLGIKPAEAAPAVPPKRAKITALRGGK